MPTESPYEHQPIIFNYGLQSKVISCPLYSIPDSILSAWMIWGLLGTHIPSHSANRYSKGDLKVINCTHCNLHVEVGWEEMGPLSHCPSAKMGCIWPLRKGFLGSGWINECVMCLHGARADTVCMVGNMFTCVCTCAWWGTWAHGC